MNLKTMADAFNKLAKSTSTKKKTRIKFRITIDDPTAIRVRTETYEVRKKAENAKFYYEQLGCDVSEIEEVE